MPPVIEKDWDMGMHVAMRDIQTLRRIVATLIALAVLAERVSSRSFPVRWLVLSVLRSADAVAREFVADATRAHPAFGAILQIRSGPEDALLLASRFRAQAAALGALLFKARRSPCQSVWIDSPLCLLAPPQGWLSNILGGWARNPNDTS